MNKTVNLLTFLQNGNIVRIRDEKEFDRFASFMAKRGLGSLLLPRRMGYKDIVGLYKLPQNVSKHPGWDGKTLCAECQIGKESIGIYPCTKAVVEWYDLECGVEPMSVDDIDKKA